MEIVGIALGVILTAWEWVAGKYTDFGTWSGAPLTAGWALAGLTYIWTMHRTTRQRVADLSKQVQGLQNQLAWLEDRLRGRG